MNHHGALSRFRPLLAAFLALAWGCLPDGGGSHGGDVSIEPTSSPTPTPTSPPEAIGALDPDFGDGGIVTTGIGMGSDFAWAVAIQPDGKIVVAGSSIISSTFPGTYPRFALARYAPDGSLDPDFGDGGIVTTDVGPRGDEIRAIAIQADGKIVVAGFSFLTFNTGFAVARYAADGSLDTGFGIGGAVTTAVGSTSGEAHALAIQPDGMIVAAGFSNNGVSGQGLALVRYAPDGSLDAGFGVGGIATTKAGGLKEANALAIQPDGKIVAAGAAIVLGKGYVFAVARFAPDGSLDAAFGAAGVATVDFGSSNEFAYALAIQPDGKIVAAGQSTASGFVLARYAPDGLPDTGFGAGGVTVTDVGGSMGDLVYALAIQPDGKIVVAGGAHAGWDYDFVAARYTPAGSLDPGFGAGGIAIPSTGDLYDSAFGVALQPDGKIVVAGTSDVGDYDREFTVVRFQ